MCDCFAPIMFTWHILQYINLIYFCKDENNHIENPHDPLVHDSDDTKLPRPQLRKLHKRPDRLQKLQAWLQIIPEQMPTLR